MTSQRMTRLLSILVPAMIYAGAAWSQAVGSAYLNVHDAKRAADALGIHVIQDITLGNDINSYTLRYEAIEPEDEPGRILPKKWAPTLGYIPIGISAPSMACWYNQGFISWTVGEYSLKDYRPTMRVVRESGSDVMVEYAWDLPVATVSASFAMTAQSDKLILFGRLVPKGDPLPVRLRLMAYPATFSKPWNRRATTAERTLASGRAELDLAQEKWLLLEDVTEGRSGDGPAGLLLGDTSAFSRVALSQIGAYGELVELELAPERQSFVLGFYEFPDEPEVSVVREAFRRGADSESASLGALVDLSLESPLPAVAVGDPERMARLRTARFARERTLLTRPSERWESDSAALSFPWLAKLPDGPVRMGLLCPRWAAYETMELGRRLPLDVRHLYFDRATDIATPSAWPYAHQTGIGTLGVGLATKEALRVCADPSRDVLMVSGLTGSAVPRPVRDAILRQVRDGGKGLMLSGGTTVLEGWPAELTVEPDQALTEAVRQAFGSWAAIPGFQDGDRGRLGNEHPFTAYRYGKGRVLVWRAAIGRYSAIVPLTQAIEGLDGALDRSCALYGLGVLAAASREDVDPLRLEMVALPDRSIRLSAASTRPGGLLGGEALVRLQDDLDRVVVLRRFPAAQLFGAGILLPAQAGGRRYFADLVIENGSGAAVACGSCDLQVTSEEHFDAIDLAPVSVPYPGNTPIVPLPEGGALSIQARVSGLSGGAYRLRGDVSDALGRVLARVEAGLGPDGAIALPLQLSRPVTTCHHVDLVLLRDGIPVRHERRLFTIPLPYPSDDFTYLVWSYARGEPVTRLVQRTSYALGTDMMDLCHMRGYSDAGAAREYEVAARSGLRLLPYVTRIANASTSDRVMKPGLFNEGWIAQQEASITTCTQQAVPYRPVAYTLGDENYLSRRGGEIGAGAEAMAAFRRWLQGAYATIEALNAAWDSTYDSFEAITEPMWLADTVGQDASFAAWFDHRRFLDESFAALHERFAGLIRRLDPGAKVGWDGFLGYTWQSGYNFYLLTRNLELNQTYTTHELQCELLRGFARPGSLRGEWGNAIADNEAGFRAISWNNLLRQHNSCWWWTSWGCDYTPFDPDGSVSAMGQWFFDEAAVLRRGIGKLVLRSQRDNAGISVLYNQADLFAAHLAGQIGGGSSPISDSRWTGNHLAVIHLLKDLGVQFDYVAAEELEAADFRLSGRVLILPMASCLSDRAAACITDFVEAGGLLLADGRFGLLTENGRLRKTRALAELFGVTAPVGKDAFAAKPESGTLSLNGADLEVPIFETGLSALPGGKSSLVDGQPVLLSRHRGRGHAVLLNIPFYHLGELRSKDNAEHVYPMLRGILAGGGVHSFVELSGQEGEPARRIEQVLFRDGDLQYLGLQQDIRWRTDEEQLLHVRAPAASFVYTPCEGVLLDDAPLDAWSVRISRGRPALFSLLPYRVTAIEVGGLPATLRAGQAVACDLTTRVSDGDVGHHVVHVSLHAPDSGAAHREYSRNVDCPGGRGRVHLSFALNDPPGQWRVRCRDAATGVSTEHALTLLAP